MTDENVVYMGADWWPRIIEAMRKSEQGGERSLPYQLAANSILVRVFKDVIILGCPEEYKPLCCHSVVKKLNSEIRKILGRPVIIAWSFMPVVGDLLLHLGLTDHEST